MAEKSRLQVKTGADPEVWSDVGAGASGLPIPVIDEVANSLVPSSYDAIIPTFGATTDTWVFKTGGVSGTTVSTITITYSDSTKATISNIVKT